MIYITSLWILIGLCLVNGQNTPVTLNLSKISRDHFSIFYLDSTCYNRYSFTHKQGFKTTEVVDSGIPIWNESDEKNFISAHVYYKEHIPQLVKIILKKVDQPETLYFKRDNGKFSNINESQFDVLSKNNSFIDRNLVLDLKKGFVINDNTFDIKKIKVFGEDFDEFLLKRGQKLLKLTNGDEIILDSSLNESLVRMIGYKRPNINKMLQITLKKQGIGESSEFFEFIREVWYNVKYTRLIELYNRTGPPNLSQPRPSSSKEEQTEDEEIESSEDQQDEDNPGYFDFVKDKKPETSQKLSSQSLDQTEPSNDQEGSPMGPIKRKRSEFGSPEPHSQGYRLPTSLSELLDRDIPNEEVKESDKPRHFTSSLSEILGPDVVKEEAKEAHEALEKDDLTLNLLLPESDDEEICTGFQVSTTEEDEETDEDGSINPSEIKEESKLKDISPHVTTEKAQPRKRSCPKSSKSRPKKTPKSRSPRGSVMGVSTKKDLKSEVSRTNSDTDDALEDVSEHLEISSQSLNLTLNLDRPDDLYTYSITEKDSGNGVSEKVYIPKRSKLTKILFKKVIWESDDVELECKQVTAHYHDSKLNGLKLDIEMAGGFSKKNYYSITKEQEVTEEDYDKFLKLLSEKSLDKTITLRLESCKQENVLIQTVREPRKYDYKVCTPQNGHIITRIIMADSVIWKSSTMFPFSDKVKLYSNLGYPAYVSINIPESKSYRKVLTFDLIELKLIDNLNEGQLKDLLTIGNDSNHLRFDLVGPLDHEKYLITKSEYKGVLTRSISAKHARVTMINENGSRITPTNIIPFMHFTLYYYKHYPIFIVTDPESMPRFFTRTKTGWDRSSILDLDKDLERNKNLIDDENLYPRTQITFVYERPEFKKLYAEYLTGEQYSYHTFIPILGFTMNAIQCNGSFLLRPNNKKNSSAVKFYIKDGENEPKKAELLIDALGGLKKIIFKVFRNDEWVEVDEDAFPLF